MMFKHSFLLPVNLVHNDPLRNVSLQTAVFSCFVNTLLCLKLLKKKPHPFKALFSPNFDGSSG